MASEIVALAARYIDVKDPTHSKLLLPSPFRSRKGAYSLKNKTWGKEGL